jgi:hypothetical protein
MAAPTIVRGSDHFFNAKWVGNGGGQRVGNFVPFTDNGTIANSCIFEPNNYLYRSIPGTATNVDKCSLSLWFKPTVLANNFGFLGTNGGTLMQLYFQTSNNLRLYDANGTDLITQRTFEDQSKFYHLMIVWDTAQSTASNRIKFYVDGDQLTEFSTATYPSQNADVSFNNSAQQLGRINLSPSGNYYYDGYMAEVNFADGQAYSPSDFGLTDTSTGRWIPKSLSGISYGNNGFRLQFATNSNLGDDTSTVGSDFTSSSLATTDQTTDSPTQNHMTFDSSRSSDWTFTEGNLTCAGTPSSGAGRHSLSNMILPKSGKYYFEMTVDVNNDSPRYFGLAKADASVTEGTTANVLPRVVVIRNGGTSDGHFISDGTTSSANGFATTSGTVINFALDATNEKLYVGKDGSYYDFEGGSGNPTNGTGATFSNIYKTIDWKAINMSFSTGTGGTSHKVTWNFGQKTFAHTAPTDFVALQQDNFPETNKGIIDFAWIKNRDASDNYQMYDTSRGVLQSLTTEAGAESTVNDGLQKFLKGGFAIEDDVSVNTNGESYVAWKWVANGGTTTANTDGSGASIASTIQANQTAGFSIVTYTGTGSAGTIAHGLSSTPKWVMASRRNDSSGDGWTTYHTGMTDASYWMDTKQSNAQNSASVVWNSTAPTNKVFSVGTSSGTNTSSKTYVAYCWHDVEGFSAFGSYIANNSADGPFIYTGFKPSWLLIKSTAAISWYIFDNERNKINPVINGLNLDVTNAEHSNQSVIDFLSNGFKIRNSNSGSGASVNSTSHDPYIYFAFAQHPFIGDGVNPCTAR